MRLLLENKAECLVYPKPYDGVLQLPEGGLGEGEGEATGPGVDDFGGLRPYVPGDPPQRVAWKVSSRGHGLQTKEFHALSGHSPLLDWDGLPEADQETRLEMLCRMLLQAEENGQPFGLRLPASEIPSGSGKQHLHRCLRELALFRPGLIFFRECPVATTTGNDRKVRAVACCPWSCRSPPQNCPVRHRRPRDGPAESNL